MVGFQDPERSVLKVREHRKFEIPPYMTSLVDFRQVLKRRIEHQPDKR